MTLPELQKIGFISQEQYDAAVRTLKSDLTGEYAGGGKTGAGLSPAALRKADAYFRAYQTEGEMWTTHYSVGKYPTKADLTANMPPVFDQGNRGSCVGQAVTALANYYFGKAPVLSAEYTYGMLKKYEYAAFAEAYRRFLDDPEKYQRIGAGDSGALRDFDGHDDDIGTVEWYLKQRFPRLMSQEIAVRMKLAKEKQVQPNLSFLPNELQKLLFQVNPACCDGSFLEVAWRVFQKEGFCTHDVLPYSHQVLEDNRGHLPMPEEAVRDAVTRRITDELYFFRSPGSIDEFKGTSINNISIEIPFVSVKKSPNEIFDSC